VNVKITSDGEGFGTHVQTEDGREIDGVTEIVWRAVAGDICRADVSLSFITLSGAADARMIGPNGKEVRRIEYADGTSEEFPAS